jgi:hypothetical protein
MKQTLHIEINEEKTNAIVTEKSSSTLRVALAKVRMKLAVGDTVSGFKILDELEESYGSHLALLQTKAFAAQQVGMWQRALQHLQKAKNLNTENEDLEVAWDSILEEQRSFFRLGFLIKRLGSTAIEQGLYIQGKQLFEDHSKHLRYLIERETIRTRSVQKVNGIIEGYKGSSIRGELHLVKDRVEGVQLIGSLFVSENNLGLGASYRKLDFKGDNTFYLQWRKAYWGFIESLVGDGIRDRIAFRRHQRIKQNLIANTEAAFNIYGIDNIYNAGSTFSLDGELYYLYKISNPSLAFGYGLSAEYVINKKEKINSLGTYHPLPLASREVHSLTAELSYQRTQKLLMRGLIGYSIDRLGSQGYLLRTSLTYYLIPTISWHLLIDHHLSLSGGAEAVDTLKTELTWYF